MALSMFLHKRQNSMLGDGSDDGDYDDSYYGGWWWSPTGRAVKYTIVAILFALALLYFVGGWMHAQRRLRKGLPPLPYHRWMVSQRRAYYADDRWAQHPDQRPHYAPGQEQHQQQGGAYGMQGFAAPPPAYNAHDAPPPTYQPGPPQVPSKVAADQNYTAPVRARAAGEGASASGAGLEAGEGGLR